MANQYSITVSNRADAVLKLLKENNYKTSQCISALIETLGYEATVRLVTYQRRITQLEEEDEWTQGWLSGLTAKPKLNWSIWCMNCTLRTSPWWRFYWGKKNEVLHLRRSERQRVLACWLFRLHTRLQRSWIVWGCRASNTCSRLLDRNTSIYSVASERCCRKTKPTCGWRLEEGDGQWMILK